MIIFSVDPGSTDSGIVIVNSRTFEIIDSMKIENNLGIISLQVEEYYYRPAKGQFVIEAIQPYGKKVGKEVFDTVEFIGAFIDRMGQKYNKWGITKINRRAVITHICEDAYGNDARIRAKLIERFGQEFTSKLKSDCWQSFALATTYIDKEKAKKTQNIEQTSKK